jgi:malonate transporter
MGQEPPVQEDLKFMLSTLSIVTPIFALICAGYVCRKSKVLSAQAASELNRFVIYLALPALLFDITVKVRLHELNQPGFIGALGLGTGGLFLLTLFTRKQKVGLADATIEGLNGSYANVGFIGIPLCAASLGKESLAPATIATIFTVCILFGWAIIVIETGLRPDRGFVHALLKTIPKLIRNPLLVAPTLGILVATTRMKPPTSVLEAARLLGSASSPCALVALGLFIAEKRPRLDLATSTRLVSLKLIAHPFVTWVLAYYVFSMPRIWAQSAVLLTALPTGTGAFMLAEFYEREASVTSSTILVSTIGSLISVTLCLFLLGR